MIIKENFEVKNLTTFKIGGTVKKAYFPQSQSEFTELLQTLSNYIVLGSCSNILFSSEGYDGNIIFTTELKDFEIRGTHIYAAAGVKGPLIAQKTAEECLTGFEFMIGFPGSIGGNICMNAGAHGQCISDNLVQCCLFDKTTKQIVYKTKDELDFGYRNSLLKTGKYILIHAEFELKKGKQDEINELIKRNQEFRKNIQPNLANPNAGSVFKNPPNDSAGRLLDKAGVKKLKVEKATVWNNHANFIVNTGNATSENVLELMSKMYNAVKENFTIELEPEIIFIGKKTKNEEKLWNLLYQKKLK